MDGLKRPRLILGHLHLGLSSGRECLELSCLIMEEPSGSSRKLDL